jgi:hypothetical protein
VGIAYRDLREPICHSLPQRGHAEKDIARIGTVDALKAYVADDLRARHNIGANYLVARRHERFRCRRTVEKLKRTGPKDEGFGLIAAVRRLVHDTHGNTIARKFSRHRESNRARADDQNLRIHTFLKQQRPRCTHIK